MSADQHEPSHQQIRADLLELACSVLEGEDAQRWFDRYHPLLGASPVEAAQTVSGAARVRELLVAIKHGGVA
jgi:uncharacterized protein (DUF2384 family)